MSYVYTNGATCVVLTYHLVTHQQCVSDYQKFSKVYIMTPVLAYPSALFSPTADNFSDNYLKHSSNFQLPLHLPVLESTSGELSNQYWSQ